MFLVVETAWPGHIGVNTQALVERYFFVVYCQYQNLQNY